MPGFGGVSVSNNVRNGNQVAVMIGDTIMYFAQTAGHQFPFGTEQLYGIGSAMPQEVQQLRVSPQITLDTFSLTEAGENALQAGVSLPYVLAGQVYDIHVYDGLGKNVIFTYAGCKAQNFSESIPANAPARDAYSFLAMDVLNSEGVSILNTGENALNVATADALTGLTQNGIGLNA